MISVKNQSDRTQIFVSGDIMDDAWKGWSWGEDVETYPQDIRDILKGGQRSGRGHHLFRVWGSLRRHGYC